jgi:3-oxoacyl-[acyl-carrier-protein] synthase II
MTDRRVVITGIGVVSPLGNDLPTFWANLIAGKSGIRRIEAFDTTEYVCRIGGEVVDYNAEQYFKVPKDARRTDRYVLLAMGAAKMAWDQSGMGESGFIPDRVGAMIGSGIGGLAYLEENHTNLITKGPKRVSPFTIPMMISNIGTGIVSMELGLCGPNMSIVTACATANNNIGEAWRIIKFGDADAFVAGGAEASILPMGLAGFGNMKALSTRNDEPERASRPFDIGRDGFVMGEGAGVVVIEELEHAKKRGASILCELVGYGVSADAHHLTAPHPEGTGASKCMNMALRHAKLNPEERTFGNYAKDGLLVSSTKSMTGHLLGAAGGVELAACVMAIQEGIIPPTINLEDQDPACDLDYVPNTAREVAITSAVSNSFGFGGHNASVVIKKFS